MRESHTPGRQRVDMGSLMKPACVANKFVSAKVVDKEKHNIWPARILRKTDACSEAQDGDEAH